MKLDPEDLDDIASAIISKMRLEQEVASSVPTERLAYNEQEAADLLGVPKNTLREWRLRGEIHAKKAGKRFLYLRTELIEYLMEGRENNN